MKLIFLHVIIANYLPLSMLCFVIFPTGRLQRFFPLKQQIQCFFIKNNKKRSYTQTFVVCCVTTNLSSTNTEILIHFISCNSHTNEWCFYNFIPCITKSVPNTRELAFVKEFLEVNHPLEILLNNQEEFPIDEPLLSLSTGHVYNTNTFVLRC